MVKSLFVTTVAALSKNTMSLISSATSGILQLLSQSSTIQNRTSNIALVVYADGVKTYIIAPVGLKVGDVVISSDNADIKAGNSKLLKRYRVGTLIHNVELHPGRGGQSCRSAGAYAQLMAKRRAPTSYTSSFRRSEKS